MGLRCANQVLAACLYGRAVPACVKLHGLHAICLRKLDKTGGIGILFEHLAGCLHIAGDDESFAGEKPREHL